MKEVNKEFDAKMQNHIPVLLFALKDPRNIIRALCGENVGTIVKE